MGNPAHYSLELPQRCLQLIDGLWDHAQQVLQADIPKLGPLTTTFLLSMSMPIINLPIERIGVPQQKSGQSYADDRGKDPELSKAIISTLGKKFREAQFYSPDAWSYCYYETNRFNIADWLPSSIVEGLATKEAEKRASEMPVSQWVFILRNALAHGGIVYLDASGRPTDVAPIGMYLFVSGDFDKGNRDKLIGLKFLRISEANYRDFLRAWVGWLEASGFANLPVAA